MRQQSLSKGVVIVLVTNVIGMIFNLLINFLQPKYLSIDSYSVIKTFVLYLSASGLCHLGYVDGMYIKYGGKNVFEIDKSEIVSNVSSMRILQIIISALILCIGLLLNDMVLILFAILLIPYNMVMYYRLLYQATGEFSLYGKIMNASTVALFVGNLVLIFVLNIQTYFWYIAIQILIYFLIWLFLEYRFHKKISASLSIFRCRLQDICENIKSGFFVMLGNFSSIFLTMMDRWLVKWLLPAVDFAGYSFATSIEGFLNVAVTPFTITFYNYFCRERRVEHIRKVHNYMLIIASFIISLAFLAKFVMEIYLPDYLFSTTVMFLLFASQIFFIIIKSIYVNLYKAERKQTLYFVKLVTVLIVGLIITVVCFLLLHNKEAMAIGTLVCSILWFLLCQNDFKKIRYDVWHTTYLIVSVVSFLLLGLFAGSLSGFFIYVIEMFLLGLIIMKRDYNELAIYVKSKIGKSDGKNCSADEYL